jgi:hypothetical protein
MKKSLVSTLFAVPLLTLSSMAFAAEPDSTESFMLSAAQMDDVTAGKHYSPHGGSDARNFARVTQINISPVIIIQIALFNSGGSITQIASVISGNFSSIRR